MARISHGLAGGYGLNKPGYASEALQLILRRAMPIVKHPLAVIERNAVAEPSNVFAQLMATIEDRRANPPPNSYTAKLFEGGVKKIRTKLIEEAAELFEAAAEPGDSGRSHLVYEAADLVYHLLVLLAQNGISLIELEQELARRFGTSGLEEKASRPKS
jgi:phosphoribosyl-ATP pyrophosphohydrolase